MSALRRRLRSPVCALLVLCLTGLTTACHTYTPVTTAPPGSTVRVQIPVRSALAGPNAPPRTESVEGQLVTDGDTIVLAVRNRMEYGAYREIVQFDTLRLAHDPDYEMAVREFSPGRSIVLGVGLTAVLATAAIAAFNSGGGGEEGPPDPGPPAPAIVSISLLGSLLDFVTGR